ncbi:BREX system ATP-binding protein BrxD [Nannocystis bainbridge]|uniref:BREX system ATP-binding protein BrxD n=1 Tax=Nannocystis bainbridge TaxID=2995303 RepID=A0ABT5E8C3_9BACT|nr:BREX system ATP-binding protein BrxD [Nannocystis bainbridge]MDC0721693.1 BREX system ATP-binding protein BrxD [Nannocystis bainbridge]
MPAVNESATIVNALRSGLVPAQGLGHFATGLEKLLGAVNEELDFVATGKGLAKWIRGEYGTGKTFAARYLCAKARERRFATAEVQISINDTPLHHLETVYRRLIERLETAADGPNAFQAVVEGWLYQIGEEVMRLRGMTEDDPNFADATEQRLEDKLADLSRRNPAFAQILRAYHRATHEGDFSTAQGLLAWLAGQPHTDRSVLRAAGTKGKVDGQASLTFLAGLLQLLRQSGYDGLVVVLDEVETIQRMNAQTREKSLNALRQLMDMLAKEELPGLYLVVTGTRDFFEGYKGLKALAPLYQRVQVNFGDDPQWDNLRATQVRLLPFTPERLLTVGRCVRDLYPAKHADRVAAKVDDRFLGALVTQITAGFGGKVALAPRLFLRELIDVMDRVDLHEQYAPAAHYKLELDDGKLTPEELAAKHGRSFEPPEAPEAEAPKEQQSAPAPRTRRLEG